MVDSVWWSVVVGREVASGLSDWVADVGTQAVLRALVRKRQEVRARRRGVVPAEDRIGARPDLLRRPHALELVDEHGHQLHETELVRRAVAEYLRHAFGD